MLSAAITRLRRFEILLRWRDRHVGTLPAAVFVVLLVPLAVTLYAWKAVVRVNNDKHAAQFQALALEGERAVLHRIESFTQALYGAAGFMQGSSYVSRDEWRAYARALDVRRNYPGMMGIGWIADVKAGDLDAFIERMRAEGSPRFAVHPATKPKGNFIISYIEPEEPNRPSLGLNIAFEQHRYEAAALARDTGNPTITQRIQLVQDRLGDAGFLLLLPLYDANMPTRTVYERRAALRGWIYTPLIGRAFLDDLSHSLGSVMTLRMYDGRVEQRNLVYLSDMGPAHFKPVFEVRDTLQVGNRPWTLVWESTPGFEKLAASYEPLLVLSGGLLLTALLGGFLMVITRRAETVQALVQERTRQLQESREALQSSEETFRAAMEHASIGMALVDPSGRFIQVNQALCKLLGYSAFELQNKTFQEITHPADLNTDLVFVRQTLAGERQSYQMEKRYFHKEGHVIWTQLSVSLVRAADGAPRYFVSQIQDITQRKQMDRMKSEFISTVSHELRTPLTSIRGSLGLIAGGVLGPLPDKVSTLIRIAHTNSERLVHIINDILDIEKIESGKLELSIRGGALAPLLRQSLEANEAYAARFNVRFVLEAVPEDVDVLADHDRFMQVMTNLLANGAKFSPLGGEVLVRAAKRPAAVRIEVQDHGTGIPKEFRSRIFEKFAQADASSSRRFEGTGLGLSICRQLVESMGGSIGFTTVTGEGTTFWFQLPRVVGSRASDTSMVPVLSHDEGVLAVLEDDKRHRVLYVEDDLDLSNVIGAALSRHVEVVTAPTLQAAERLLRDQRFSLVVLDLTLPDGSGLRLLEQINALVPSPVPVVILSATEASREVQQRVAATLVKSRMSEERTVEVILSVLKLRTVAPAAF
jgi:PAS domain S-box-containing protein